MAQQTQVGRVVAYYERWLARWPTAAALAAASPADVLREWAGLGYNRRALRLREAAAIVARDGWPRDAAGLRALPGVGPYTAAAVASFAFGEPVAAVDTNVRRVAERLGADPQALCRASARRTGTRPRWSSARCSARRGWRTASPARRRRGARRAGAWRSRPGPHAARHAQRFEDTDRWVRGRVIAALVAGEQFPSTIAPERLERALAALERDGLVEREGSGLGLPRLPR